MNALYNFFYDLSTDIESVHTPPKWEGLIQTALGTENRISSLLLRSRVASLGLRIFGASLGVIAAMSLARNTIHPNRANLLLSIGAGIIAHDCLQAGLNIKSEIDALKSSDDKSLLEKAAEKIALAKKALSLSQMDKIERWIHLACPNTWVCQPIYKKLSADF